MDQCQTHTGLCGERGVCRDDQALDSGECDREDISIGCTEGIIEGDGQFIITCGGCRSTCPLLPREMWKHKPGGILLSFSRGCSVGTLHVVRHIDGRVGWAGVGDVGDDVGISLCMHGAQNQVWAPGGSEDSTAGMMDEDEDMLWTDENFRVMLGEFCENAVERM